MGKHDDEDGAELAARALLEREFGCPLIRIAPAAVPTVDYRAAEPARGVEVKQITSEAYRDLSAAARRALHWDSTILTDVRVTATNGEVLRDFDLDPTRDYQPQPKS